MSIFLGLLFSTIGGLYMLYGKRSSEPSYIVVGALLAVYVYFFSNVWLIFGIGAILCAVPYALRRGLL